jgi:hypothetical protein
VFYRSRCVSVESEKGTVTLCIYNQNKLQYNFQQLCILTRLSPNPKAFISFLTLTTKSVVETVCSELIAWLRKIRLEKIRQS